MCQGEGDSRGSRHRINCWRGCERCLQQCEHRLRNTQEAGFQLTTKPFLLHTVWTPTPRPSVEWHYQPNDQVTLPLSPDGPSSSTTSVPLAKPEGTVLCPLGGFGHLLFKVWQTRRSRLLSLRNNSYIRDSIFRKHQMQKCSLLFPSKPRSTSSLTALRRTAAWRMLHHEAQRWQRGLLESTKMFQSLMLPVLSCRVTRQSVKPHCWRKHSGSLPLPQAHAAEHLQNKHYR